MNEQNYDEWAEDKIDTLLNLLVFSNGYEEETIRECLVFTRYRNEGSKLLEFFRDRDNDETLFKILIEILLDESEDYSNDARYSAAFLISSFDESILKKHKNALKYAQNYPIYNLRPFSDGNVPSWLME